MSLFLITTIDDYNITRVTFLREFRTRKSFNTIQIHIQDTISRRLPRIRWFSRKFIIFLLFFIVEKTYQRPPIEQIVKSRRLSR